MIINKKKISKNSPSYFIADLASNHDGDLERAKDLIWISKESGADCAKFQHFLADKIVSDYGFKNMKISHQANWNDSVFNVYQKYQTPREWTDELVATCKKADIEFMTTPYDIEAIELFEDLVHCFKIGSGDITYLQLLQKISATQKPVILSTGASSLKEIEDAMNILESGSDQICVMQCNTNYTGSDTNVRYQNLNVLKTLEKRWPNAVLGLSDHTSGHTSVLGAIAMGARIIEKHFTDDNSRNGPDHGFSMNPKTWKTMIEKTRELEDALGISEKKIEDNEKETVIVQRRSIRMKSSKKANETIELCDIEFLRPCPITAINPMFVKNIIGKKLNKNKEKGEEIYPEDLN